LGDRSKLVQRTHFGLARRLQSLGQRAGEPLLDALTSPDARTRWGATAFSLRTFLPCEAS